MNRRDIQLEYRDVGPGQGVLTTPDGDALPRPLDRSATMDLVQRFVETERYRTRRMLGWLGGVFLLLLLAVLAVSAGLGIFLMRQSRAAAGMAREAQKRSAVIGTQVGGVMAQVSTLETRHEEVRTAVTQERVERNREEDMFKRNLERFSEWVALSRVTEPRGTLDAESRLAEMERKWAASQAEARALSEQHATALAAVSERLARETRLAAEQVEGVDAVPAAVSPADAGAAVSLPEELLRTLDSISDPAWLRRGAVADVEHDGRILAVTLSNGDRYEGTFLRGRPQGKGICRYRNGDVYEGEFVAGERHGWGSVRFENGDIYEGEFRHDRITGRGVWRYRGGHVYTGEFRDGVCHGYGVLKFQNGDIYTGEFRDGARSGRGIYLFGNGAKYVGEFENGKRHGKGRYVFAGGGEYAGEYKDGKKDGRGVCVYPDGRRLDGIWEGDTFVRAVE